MPRNNTELSELGDAALAELVRAGSADAFAELWQRHSAAGTAAARQFSAIADPQDIVSESYLRIFRAFQHGGGPSEAFRPYLYRTIRNIALDWRAKQASVSLDDAPELEQPDSDPEITVLENVVTARAFRELPERWQAVLWYLEVEGMAPAEAAPLIGLSPNATSALSVRAREGFKKAWLQAHVNDLTVPQECRWTTERMGQYARHGLTPRARARFDHHLENCTRCPILLEEIDSLDGHLGSILLPAVLGGGAGGALHAQLSQQSPPSSASARTSVARKASIAAGGAAVLVLVASGALALSGQWQAAPGLASADTDDSQPTSASTPDPESTPSPQTSAPAPPAPTQTPLPTTPRPPVDRTAPAVPTLAEPVDGTLTRIAQPVFSGTGEAGARVEIVRIDPATGIASTVLVTRVGAGGAWSSTAVQPLADGIHDLRVSQVDAAGNRSAELRASLTVDTVALPPVMDALPAGPLLYLPTIAGSAEPLAVVTLRDEAGTTVAVTSAGSDGRWSTPLADPQSNSVSLTVAQQDQAGNVSPWSTSSTQLDFERPLAEVPSVGGMIPSTGGSTVVTVQLSGRPGLQVQVFIDGVTTGNVHTLEPTPIGRLTPPLPDGPHSIGVRYFDPATGEVGPTYTVAFEIG